ncbi:unnamed protein product [Amoebophrya sp. A120]|nr:unnamed protein product [Amoebophrya sp. A120]|eukprot:GSA120T00024037001.1
MFYASTSFLKLHLHRLSFRVISIIDRDSYPFFTRFFFFVFIAPRKTRAQSDLLSTCENAFFSNLFSYTLSLKNLVYHLTSCFDYLQLQNFNNMGLSFQMHRTTPAVDLNRNRFAFEICHCHIDPECCSFS